jgi:hypothetical protein
VCNAICRQKAVILIEIIDGIVSLGEVFSLKGLNQQRKIVSQVRNGLINSVLI